MSPAERARRFLLAQNTAPGHWRQHARRAIFEALSQCGPRDTAEAVLKACDAAYPFGPREHHPYKAWLKERALLKRGLGLAKVGAFDGVMTPLFERKVEE